MGVFKPSDDFVVRTMEGVRSYEAAMKGKRERLYAIFFSKPVFCILITGGALLGALNLGRIASLLISPAACL